MILPKATSALCCRCHLLGCHTFCDSDRAAVKSERNERTNEGKKERRKEGRKMSLSEASDMSFFEMFTYEQYIAITISSFIGRSISRALFIINLSLLTGIHPFMPLSLSPSSTSAVRPQDSFWVLLHPSYPQGVQSQEEGARVLLRAVRQQKHIALPYKQGQGG